MSKKPVQSLLSIFANSKSKKPYDTITLEYFISAIKNGTWKTQIETLRAKEDEHAFKIAKTALPAITISGNFTARDKFTDVAKRLSSPSGYIAIDIDKKDNPSMRSTDIVDTQAIAQYTSCSGQGCKVIYLCKATSDPKEHRRIYDGVIRRLEGKGITLKVDPIVKSIVSLQYVSYDPAAYWNPKTKLVINPLPAIKRVPAKPLPGDVVIGQLEEYIAALGKKDITANYEQWLHIAMGLSHSLGEGGRQFFHTLSKHYKGYSKSECDEKYDGCVEGGNTDNPITMATVFQIMNEHLPKVKKRKLMEKYLPTHAVGVGEDTEQGDLAGHVRYGLFLYKKVIDKKEKKVQDLTPARINLNAFEALLKSMGFYRYAKFYVRIVDNIIEEVDTSDILRLITEHVEKSGNAKFTYQDVEYEFSWEELAHLWRGTRATSGIAQQIAASLPHWIPNVLRDSADTSYIPYSNGVVEVKASGYKLLPYSQITQQIWKERILPRPFTYTAKAGMFEEFFGNVTGDRKAKCPSTLRAKWYYGYMLHSVKRQSTARAWLLYDVKSGNNGRSGKTILGNALGKIRSVTVIDGKQVDLKNRFAWQTVKPYTNILFIDDPAKHISINPFFNMITGTLYADMKSAKPLELDLKILFASNFVLEAGGESEKGRQFVTQVNDYYVQWGREHGDTITPIVDYHGKEFFTDWNANDWAAFDSFAVRCLQYYFRSDSVPVAEISGNSAQLRFIQIYEEELFHELCEAFKAHAKSTSAGTIVPQQILTGIIREGNEHLKANKAGKIAREFLEGIGAKNISISTSKVNSIVKMVYSTPINKFNLGPAGGTWGYLAHPPKKE